MPIQHALWKDGAQPTPLSLGKLASEQAAEDMIVRKVGILSAEWMLIGDPDGVMLRKLLCGCSGA